MCVMVMSRNDGEGVWQELGDQLGEVYRGPGMRFLMELMRELCKSDIV